jgi:hypothetical protein
VKSQAAEIREKFPDSRATLHNRRGALRVPMSRNPRALSALTRTATAVPKFRFKIRELKWGEQRFQAAIQ